MSEDNSTTFDASPDQVALVLSKLVEELKARDPSVSNGFVIIYEDGALHVLKTRPHASVHTPTIAPPRLVRIK